MVESERTATTQWASTMCLTKSKFSVTIHQRGQSRRKRIRVGLCTGWRLTLENWSSSRKGRYLYTIMSQERYWFIYSSCSVLHTEFYNQRRKKKMSTKISNERYSLNIEMTTAMVDDYQLVLKKFWQTVWLEGEAVPHQHCLQWKLGAAAISHWCPFHRGGRGWGVRGWFIHHISWSHWSSWEATQRKGNGEGWDQDRGPVSECCPGWQTSAALHGSWG